MKKLSNLNVAKSYIKSRKNHFWTKGNIPRYETMNDFLTYLETRKRMSAKQLEEIMTLGIDMEMPKAECRIIYV